MRAIAHFPPASLTLPSKGIRFMVGGIALSIPVFLVFGFSVGHRWQELYQSAFSAPGLVLILLTVLAVGSSFITLMEKVAKPFQWTTYPGLFMGGVVLPTAKLIALHDWHQIGFGSSAWYDIPLYLILSAIVFSYGFSYALVLGYSGWQITIHNRNPYPF